MIRANTKYSNLNPLGFVAMLAFVLSFPNVVIAQCEGEDCNDCNTLARISSSLPRLSATDLRGGRFNVTARLDQNSVEDQFTISYLVGIKSIFKITVPRPESVVPAGGWKITATKKAGDSTLDVWFGYGAGGKVYCQFVIYATLESDRKSLWHYKALPQKPYEPTSVTNRRSSSSSVASGNWEGFYAAFRTAVQKRDRVAMLEMMAPDFTYSCCDNPDTNGNGETRDEALRNWDNPKVRGWDRLSKVIAQGTVPEAAWRTPRGGTATRRIAPPSANRKDFYGWDPIKKEYKGWAAVFELRNNRWYFVSFE